MLPRKNMRNIHDNVEEKSSRINYINFNIYIDRTELNYVKTVHLCQLYFKYSISLCTKPIRITQYTIYNFYFYITR